MKFITRKEFEFKRDNMLYNLKIYDYHYGNSKITYEDICSAILDYYDEEDFSKLFSKTENTILRENIFGKPNSKNYGYRIIALSLYLEMLYSESGYI